MEHFPGLGAATAAQNTDKQPVIINLPASTLRAVDELPYRAAVKAGAKLAMASWARYPALDPRLPAGLSPTIIQGDLEGRLGFSGVTITDALGAGALAVYGSLPNKTMLAGPGRHGRTSVHRDQAAARTEVRRWPEERLPRRRAAEDRIPGTARAAAPAQGQPADLTRVGLTHAGALWAPKVGGAARCRRLRLPCSGRLQTVA